MTQDNRNLPPYPARMPHQRHSLVRVTVRSLAKHRNTVVESWIDVRADIDAINRGEGVRHGETFQVHGRIYQVKPDGALYPIAGAGIHLLGRGGYKALGVSNVFGLTERAEQILDLMRVSALERRRARDTWRSEWERP